MGNGSFHYPIHFFPKLYRTILVISYPLLRDQNGCEMTMVRADRQITISFHFDHFVARYGMTKEDTKWLL